MERRVINPWQWQDQFQYAQGIEITAGQRVLDCAGQASMNADGQPAHAGDMRAQINQVFDNLETVLHTAGYTLSDVVRLNYYTTDTSQLFGNWDVIATRLTAGECRCSSTLLGVTALAFPELMVEIEATAVR